MNEQMSLFDIKEPDFLETQADNSYLDEYALVYLITMHAGVSGNLFILKTEDAKTFCSDDCSHGKAFQGSWMMMWTTIRHFIHQNDTYDGRLEKFVFVKDTGKQDKDFERLGIRKPTRHEITEILHNMGYIPVWK